VKQQWIPGLPGKIEPDRLYAVLRQPTAGYSVGIVIRGDDCNWRGPDVLGHYPLPLKMNSAEANRLLRIGEYVWPAPPVPCKDSMHCERDDCGRGPNPACPEYKPFTGTGETEKLQNFKVSKPGLQWRSVTSAKEPSDAS
jgi:hypothetical protein